MGKNTQQLQKCLLTINDAIQLHYGKYSIDYFRSWTKSPAASVSFIYFIVVFFVSCESPNFMEVQYKISEVAL